MHQYIYTPTGDLWPAASVNSCVPPVPDPAGGKKDLPATTWLDRNQAVEQMTWAPGEPREYPGPLPGRRRLGRPPRRPRLQPLPAADDPRDSRQRRAVARPCPSDVRQDDGDHIVNWLAHRVQLPGEKINHASCSAAARASARTPLLEPVKQAVGPWNFVEVSPVQMLGRFNGFLKAVILRVSEARDLGEVNRFAFYDHMKAFLAAPPDMLARRREEHARVHDPERLRRHPDHQPQDRRPLPAGRRPPPLRRLVRPAGDAFRRRLLPRTLRLVRRRRHRDGRRLPAAARPHRLQPEGAAAEDAGLLRDRRRVLRARRTPSWCTPSRSSASRRRSRSTT